MAKIIENFKNKRENYGKKGNNLKVLMELFNNNPKIRVPDTLILPVSMYKKVINDNGNIDFSNYNNIYINPQLKSEILESIHKKFGSDKLVIRSSATCEDSIFFSASGQYDSFLNIDDDEKIIEAIKKVYASLFSENSKLYSKIYGINLKKQNMAVLIQKVAPVVESGVVFSCNPIDFSKNYIIESTKGLGTNVVEGNGNINHIEIKHSEKDYIQENKIKMIIDAVESIKKKFGFDVDVEWGIDKNNILYIFQTRPIIYKNISFDINYDDKIVTDKCIPISKGFCIGKIENITKNTKGNILYQNDKYNFNNLELLLSSKGVILKENAELSHFSNILRELVKPCVYIDNFNYKEDKLYVIDAFNGNIIDFSALPTKNKIDLMFSAFNYMKTILKDSFEKYNGILTIKNDDKYEEVIFNIDENEVKNLLIKNGFQKKVVNQGIYTYDFPDKSLIDNDTIFRIQVSNKKINIQFKLLDTAHESYRIEKGIIIDFDCLKNAKAFMHSYGMIETGYQERTITKYECDDISVNIIKWPGCSAYLGIEGKTLKDLQNINKTLKLDNCIIKGWGGKQIFEELNLKLENCKFK